MERDIFGLRISDDMTISTHTLTWSVTGVFAIFVKFFTNFNSHAHVERDITYFHFIIIKSYFNSHAHVERDKAKKIREVN